MAQRPGTLGVLINTTTPWLVYASLARQVDYFGEGTSDFTMWRPSTGTFFSEDGLGHTLIKPWGENGDIPVIGDYDGDGKTDVAVFRPSNGTWYIIPSSTGKAYGVQFGIQGDVPVEGRLRRRWQDGHRGISAFERDLVHHSKQHRQSLRSAVWNPR